MRLWNEDIKGIRERETRAIWGIKEIKQRERERENVCVREGESGRGYREVIERGAVGPAKERTIRLKEGKKKPTD
jgi:hypothetical protein